MNAVPLWLTEADVVGLIPMSGAIAAVERCLMLEARGEAVGMTKTVARFKDEARSLQALGAAAPALGLAVTKTWVQTPQGGLPLLVAFDAKTAETRAVIEAKALSQIRTGALAGVATRRLAAAGADELGIIGAGKQAWTQVAAVSAVRKLKRLRVWSPTPANRERFAAKMRDAFGYEVVAAESPERAVAGAPIVTTAAEISKPILSSAMVARGAHINAVSATISGRAELALDILPRAAVVCVDSIAGVRDLSDEFRAYFGAKNAWHDVTPLARVVAESMTRPADADLTLYKGIGTGIADLALAAEVLEQAARRGIGLQLPKAAYVDPRLTSD